MLLLLTAVMAIVLGLGLPTVGVYVIMATLIAPALVKVGIAPMAAHMFLLYFGIMSMVTPPVALAAFAAANIAGADVDATGWTATRIGWAAYLVPFLFVLSPPLLMQGHPLVIAWAVFTAASASGWARSAWSATSTRRSRPDGARCSSSPACSR